MDDTEIQATVESILGKGAKVVDCEKKSTIREEEVLLVNGCPIRLDGAEGAIIRDALMHGTAPHSDLLNQILIRAGVLSTPVRLETSLSVKSSVVTREHITIAKGGKVIDGRSRETKEDNFYNSSTEEVWEPMRAPSSCSGSTKMSSTTSEAPVWEPITSHSSLTSISKGPTSTSVASTTSSSSTTNSTSESSDDLEPPHDRLDGLSLLTDLTSLSSLSQSTPPGVSNGSDVPMSQETTPSQDNAMMFREGNLVSGRLEALVTHLVPTADYYPDRAFLFAFLLTSRLFIKPHDLLGQILALSDAQLKSKPSAKERAALLPRMVQLLGEWSETFPYDFRDERVMSHVRDVAHRCVSVEGPVRQEVSLLLHNLLYRLKKLEQYEAFLHSIHTEATTSSIESLSQTDVNELCGSAESLAQQLTHIELERLSYIGPEEFVQAFAKESPALETCFKDMKQTRNLESYVSWFNRLSYFVATEVCKHIKSKKQRVRVVEFWVETARECFNIGNFNSLMAIIAGLNMSPISRLKRTWSKVQCAKFSVLEHQMDPSSNFSSYRSTLKAAVWRSAAATDDSQRIVIPFFSLLVKDLYFLNEGCSNKLPNGHINFEKFWQLAKQVTEFITWKQVHCPFPKAAKVITYLQATPVLNEDALALASFECEPPENHEKDRYKSLKAELEKSGSN
uniref:Ras-GEF domain-containing family member 1B n=1 Tax=Lygus hesperus TaxID=30085 RepID=A0A146M4U1_LYGHE